MPLCVDLERQNTIEYINYNDVIMIAMRVTGLCVCVWVGVGVGVVEFTDDRWIPRTNYQ